MGNKILCALFATVILASCASQKTATIQLSATGNVDPSTEYVAKVITNMVPTANIVGNATVNMKFGEKEITVPGSIHMRKNQVIRIQLYMPFLGTEVARLEFTPSSVLVLDRVNKQVIKGDYNQLDFLSDNGLSFYSLQALFWNQLTAPNKQLVLPADAPLFKADLSGMTENVPLTFTQGRLKYQWNTSRKNGLINSAVITYQTTSSGVSMLSWLYSDFTTMGNTKFPRTQDFSFQTTINGKKQQGEIKIKMSEVKTNSDWGAKTDYSSKYREVSAEELFSRLMKM